MIDSEKEGEKLCIARKYIEQDLMEYYENKIRPNNQIYSYLKERRQKQKKYTIFIWTLIILSPIFEIMMKNYEFLSGKRELNCCYFEPEQPFFYSNNSLKNQFQEHSINDQHCLKDNYNVDGIVDEKYVKLDLEFCKEMCNDGNDYFEDQLGYKMQTYLIFSVIIPGIALLILCIECYKYSYFITQLPVYGIIVKRAKIIDIFKFFWLTTLAIFICSIILSYLQYQIQTQNLGEFHNCKSHKELKIGFIKTTLYQGSTFQQYLYESHNFTEFFVFFVAIIKSYVELLNPWVTCFEDSSAVVVKFGKSSEHTQIFQNHIQNKCKIMSHEQFRQSRYASHTVLWKQLYTSATDKLWIAHLHQQVYNSNDEVELIEDLQKIN